MSDLSPQSQPQGRQSVYVLQARSGGTYEVMADKAAVDVFFEQYDRNHYWVSREPVNTAEGLKREREVTDMLIEELSEIRRKRND